MARDPVCGMFVDEKKAKFKLTYDGNDYFFCSAGCKNNFEKDPMKYLGTSRFCCRRVRQ